MRQDVAQRMSWSAQLFRDVVWPVLSPHLGNARAVPVESVTERQFAKELDTQAGIDAWVIHGQGYVRGLASRVQRGDRNWRTFTVRMSLVNGRPTEYHKRKMEMATEGAITPHYWAHAYVSAAGSLLGAAVAKASDVVLAVSYGIGQERRNPDGTVFWCVPWDELPTSGYKLIEVGG
jgi:hypothetical protein